MDEYHFQIPRLFRWLSKISDILNVVLFRNSTGRNNIHFNESGYMLNQSMLSSEDLSDEDDDDSEYLNIDPSEDINRMIIERLFAVPNLWLHTELISNEYINKLPVWNFQDSRIIDCNHNHIIAESSCQSSTSDDEYLNSKDDFEETELYIHNRRRSFFEKSSSGVKESGKKINNYEQYSRTSPSTSKNKYLEEVIHDHIKSSIRFEIFCLMFMC